MGLLRWVLVRILLVKTFTKLLGGQFYIKLSKVTRRSRSPIAFYRKLVAGCDFLRSMWEYDREVIRCARRCFKRLAREDVQEVLVFGDRGVREVFYDLTFEIPIKVKMIRDYWEKHEDMLKDSVTLEVGAASRDKIIIASLVNIEERVRRIRELGVENNRIILLD